MANTPQDTIRCGVCERDGAKPLPGIYREKLKNETAYFEQVLEELTGEFVDEATAARVINAAKTLGRNEMLAIAYNIELK